MVALDGGDGIAHDQLYLGDPRLLPVERATGGADSEEVRRFEHVLARLKREHDRRRELPRVYGVKSIEPPPIHVLDRGDPETPTGILASAGAVSAVDVLDAEFVAAAGEGERRRALARWITDARNPFTARVWVNRIWQQHFGRGIVETPSDFGERGARPTHPRLLDWLASELMANGWSTKHIHRLIVTSRAYRQVSAGLEDTERTRHARATDSENRFLWRMNPRRLEVEALRDSVLLAAGSLRSRMHGPGYEAFRYEEEYAPEYHPVDEDRPEWWRRTIYRFVVRSTPDPFLTTLGCPDPSTWTPRRIPATTATQALAMFNNRFMLSQSARFAERLRRVSTTVREQIARAYQLAFQRNPDESESVNAEDLVRDAGVVALCRGLFNTAEFAWVD